MTAQLSLGGMPRRLYSCTPSRLNAWLDCPRRFRFAYLDRPRPPRGPPWAHNSLGVSVHNALRDWWLLPPEERTPAAGASCVDRAWLRAGYRDDRQEAAVRAAARQMVQGYVATLDPDDEPAGVERGVATTTTQLAIHGRVDRIDRVGATEPTDDTSGAELVIVDYKTGRSPLTRDDTRGSLALALYAVAAARTLRTPCMQVELHHLPTGQVLEHRHTAESLGRHVARAEAIAQEASTAERAYATGDTEAPFPARPGRQCGSCDYRGACAVGQVAAPPREPWASLDPAYG